MNKVLQAINEIISLPFIGVVFCLGMLYQQHEANKIAIAKIESLEKQVVELATIVKLKIQ